MNNLKNLITLLTCFIIVFPNLNAQKKFEQFEYKKGTIEVDAGIGLVPTFTNIDSKSRISPLSLTVSYRIKEHLRLGTYFGFSSTRMSTPIDEKGTTMNVQNDFYLVGLRMSGHVQRDRMNFYGGAMIGYNFSNVSTDIPEIERVNNIVLVDGKDLFTYSGFIGVKYLATEKMGIFGEIGYGVSLITLGVSYKLKQ